MVSFFGEMIEQLAETCWEFVGASGAGSDMEEQEETVEPVGVLFFFPDDAVENGFSGDEVGGFLAGVIGIRAGAGRVIDQGQPHLIAPTNDLRIVPFVGRDPVDDLFAGNSMLLQFFEIGLQIGHEFVA